MRICYLATPNVHTNRWMEYFSRQGHEIHLITSSSITSNVNTHLIKKLNHSQSRIINYTINSVYMLREFRQIIHDIKPDILHIHQITDTSLLPVITKFHPLVVTPWGSDVLVLPQQSNIYRWIAQRVVSHADLITCDAEHIINPLCELGGNLSKINIIYFGTDVDEYKPDKRDNHLREQWGVSSTAVISTRHFEPIYDVESLIIAVPFILEECPDAKIVLIGKGSQENKIRNLALSLHVQDNVLFIGSVPSKDMPRCLASADIYVSTALSDAGLSASTAEAMACGVAPVITDFGDNSKWVTPDVNGYLVPMSYPYALASRIINLIKDTRLRHEFGRLSREVIVQRNNWTKEMAKMDILYKRLGEVT